MEKSITWPSNSLHISEENKAQSCLGLHHLINVSFALTLFTPNWLSAQFILWPRETEDGARVLGLTLRDAGPVLMSILSLSPGLLEMVIEP